MRNKTNLLRAWAAPLTGMLCLTILPALTQAQETKDPYKKTAPPPQKPEMLALAVETRSQVFATVEWIEMEAKDALTLIRKGLPPNSAEFIAALRKKEEEGAATVLDTISCVTRSGQRCTVESTHERIYPTEYKENTVKGLSDLDLSSVQSKDPRFAFVQEPSTTATPSAFEMRPVGARFELEPVISQDGKVVDVNLAPEMVRYAGAVEYGKASMSGQLVPLTEQPIFVSTKVTTALTLLSGQTAVIGMCTPVRDDGTIESTKRIFTLLQVVAFSESTP